MPWNKHMVQTRVLLRQLAHQLYETDRGDAFALRPRFCAAVNEIALLHLERLSRFMKAARLISISGLPPGRAVLRPGSV